MSVLLCHTMLLFYPFTSGWGELLFNLISWATGYYGVEIFFVLSGFLIGNIFIKNVVLNPKTNNKLLLMADFWMRRWVRTLPNYFLFLLINFALIPLVPETSIQFDALLKYFVFAQAIFPNTSSFFGVSWSLAVEEWFYILLPLLFVFVCFLNNRSRKKSFFLAMMLLFLIPTVLKIIYISFQPIHSNVESIFHYGTFYKLDSIFYGLAMAWVWNETALKNWFIRHRIRFFVLGCIILLFSFLYAYLFIIKPVQNTFLVLLYAPITSMSIVLCFPFLHEWKPKVIRFKKSITFISLISYSLYLVHVPLINVYKYFAKIYTLPTDVFSISMAFILINCLSILFSYLIYRFFEEPILGYREKIALFLFSPNKRRKL